MVAADSLRCASQVLLGALLWTGHPSLPLIMALSACVEIGNAFHGPAENGLITQLAGLDRIGCRILCRERICLISMRVATAERPKARRALGSGA
jgi:hypothetical protein